MCYLLDGLYILASLIALPWLGRKRRATWWPRFWGPGPNDLAPPTNRNRESRFSPNSDSTLPLRFRKRRVWLHGVSLGEVHVLHRLVPELRRQFPETEFFISSTTDTGLSEARRLFSDACVFRFPFDFSWAVERALRSVRPDLIVLAESEWWPNLLLLARRFRIPVVAVNVRVSPTSRQRYRWFASLARRWISTIAVFLVQTQEDADWLIQLGIDPGRIHVLGSLKYDGNSGCRDDPSISELRRQFGIRTDEVVWICGSTQAEEEPIALDVYQSLVRDFPELRLILVPRHPERFDEVASELERRGLAFVRRSRLGIDAIGGATRRIILVDSVGELRLIWGLADIAFVGGSLDGRRGGQNMIEPASYGAAVLFGPHTWNFRATVAQLLQARAAREVADASSLHDAIRQLLEDPVQRWHLGNNAQRFVQSQQGAVQRAVERLARFFRPDPASLPSAA